MRKLFLATAILAITSLASRADAQYAATQDSTLRGVQKVALAFANPGGALTPPDLAQAIEYVSLELRKSGVLVARTEADIDPAKDAVLNVSFSKVSRSLSTDLSLRIDVEQRATLARTGQLLRLVTWFYEDDRRNIVPDQVIQPMLKQGVDKFLIAWLTANGR